MAWIFSLSIECGPERAAAEAVLTQLRRAEVRGSIVQDPDGNWWCVLIPVGAGENVREPREAQALTATGHDLYQRLRAVMGYRYALVGVEVDLFRTFSELRAEERLDFDGLVVADATWEELGRPSGFEPFSSGYRWRPYRGETWSEERS